MLWRNSPILEDILYTIQQSQPRIFLIDVGLEKLIGGWVRRNLVWVHLKLEPWACIQILLVWCWYVSHGDAELQFECDDVLETFGESLIDVRSLSSAQGTGEGTVRFLPMVRWWKNYRFLSFHSGCLCWTFMSPELVEENNYRTPLGFAGLVNTMVARNFSPSQPIPRTPNKMRIAPTTTNSTNSTIPTPLWQWHFRPGRRRGIQKALTLGEDLATFCVDLRWVIHHLSWFQIHGVSAPTATIGFWGVYSIYIYKYELRMMGLMPFWTRSPTKCAWRPQTNLRTLNNSAWNIFEPTRQEMNMVTENWSFAAKFLTCLAILGSDFQT